jgi:succinyl-CoA:acetate CoA-transferase
MSADEAALLIRDGMNVGVSGFTPSGCPKAVPLALAEQVRSGRRKVRIGVFSGASTGSEVDTTLAPLGVIARRMPYMTSDPLRDAINGKTDEEVCYADNHLGMFAQNARYGFYGKVDVALIEVCRITEEGHLIPTTAHGCSQTWIDLADKVIVELNLAQPAGLEGFHDVYRVADPPVRQPIPLTHINDRIGVPWLECPPEKIAAIVVTRSEEHPRTLLPPDAGSEKIAENLIRFLKAEQAAGRISYDRVPLQSGVGSTANAVLVALKESGFRHLNFYSEVIQDGVLDLIDAGVADFASTASLTFSGEAMKRFYANLDRYRGKLLVRDSEISNNAEVIRRLGVISMNTALEMDIYGNVNSSQRNGTTMVNGIGGSCDFSRSASLTIFMRYATTKGGAVSTVVPMCSHIDHTEHDVDVLITDEGYADLRGRSPKERARLIIENCAAPAYRPYLRRYFEDACKATGNAQTPHILSRAFELYDNLAKTGRMLPAEKGE